VTGQVTPQQPQAPVQAPTQPTGDAEKALIKWADKVFQKLSKGRYAEERSWYLAALFYQGKQWLTWDGGGKRWKPIEQNANKPVPMPVSDYFWKAINSNANSLGAQIPQFVGNAHDTSPVNRRAAEAAERACDELDRETGFEVLNPVVAKHTVLFGMGVTKEVVKRSMTQQMPEFGIEQGEDGMEQAQVSQMVGVPQGTLKTELPTIFEIYIPRSVHNPNLSPLIYQRSRFDKGDVVQQYGEAAEELKTEQGGDTSQIYADAIRSQVNFGNAQGDSAEQITVNEVWLEWSQLDEETQDAVEAEWGNQPSAVYQDKTKLEAAQEFGLYLIYGQGADKCLDCGENPWDGHRNNPYTFYLWEVDPANPYPMGLSSRLISLQKQLNRLDSIMELANMVNGVGKWISPVTQNGVSQFGGNPVDVIWYDPIGDGKMKPEFIMPNSYGQQLVQKRMQILSDFQVLGGSNGVDEGEAPSGVKAFRGLALLAAKSDEEKQTTRFLWEQAQELRKRKLLIMAQKVWDEPRQANIAGFNGRFGMVELMGKDLTGDYTLSVIPDSSVPKTLSDKMSAFQTLLEGQLVDPTDVQTRDYVFDTLGMTDLNPSDHYQYLKSERDLEKLKQGQHPSEVPFEKWDIALKVFSQYTLTEEFEELDPAIQQGIVLYATYISDKLTMIKQTNAGMNPAAPNPAQMLAGAIGNSGVGGDPLSGVPGQNVDVHQVEQAASKQGQQIANAVSPQ
jgi:hypothetical protein